MGQDEQDYSLFWGKIGGGVRSFEKEKILLILIIL